MTAEKVIPGMSNEPIPAGTSIYWVNPVARLAYLYSLPKGEGFRVVTEDYTGGEHVVAVTSENKREFLLPNGQMVIPA